MPRSRDTAGGGFLSPGVLQEIGKENVQAHNNGNSALQAMRGKTPTKDVRRKLGVVKLFQDDDNAMGVTASASSSKTPGSSQKKQQQWPQQQQQLLQQQRSDALSRAEAQTTKAMAALKQRNDRVKDLKAVVASANERHMTLLKRHKEVEQENTLIRTQLAASSSSSAASGGVGTAGNIERLKAENERLETSNGLLREERGSLTTRLSKREAAYVALKDDLAASSLREESLREEVDQLRAELESTSLQASEGEEQTLAAQASAATTSSGGKGNAEWTLQKAALDAQVQELEEQSAAAGRRCASVAAERAVLTEESARRAREHDATVTSLQEELQSLHRRTSADIGDWQRRHREAVAARNAVAEQLERLLGAGKSIATVTQRQAALEESLKEACNLLSTVLDAAVSTGGGKNEDNPDGEIPGVASAGRVAEGILEHVLGRVFEATGEEGKARAAEDEGAKEREAEHELRREALAALGETLEKLTGEMVR